MGSLKVGVGEKIESLQMWLWLDKNEHGSVVYERSSYFR